MSALRAEMLRLHQRGIAEFGSHLAEIGLKLVEKAGP